LNFEIVSKRLELLRELLPRILNPLNHSDVVETGAQQAQAAAQMLGFQTIQVLQASTEHDLEESFSTLVQRGQSGIMISPDTFFSGKSAELAALALRHAVPAISPYREFVRAGGLMSYGVSITDLYRLVGVYTGRILKGEKPAEIPVKQATKMELLINLKTAKTLGLEVPRTLLAGADEVIE
jgi:putative ABC transport system substrate-binding protein